MLPDFSEPGATEWQMVGKESTANRKSLQLYQRIAPFYDLIYGALLQPGRQLAMTRLAPRPGERILEIGVGTGLDLVTYPDGCMVVAIDLSASMIARADARRRRHCLEHVALCRMDAARLGFASQSFDAVYAPYVINLVPDPVAVAREMLRVCRLEGRVVLLNHCDHPGETNTPARRVAGPLASRLTGVNWNLPLREFVRDSDLQPPSYEPDNLARASSLVVCRRRCKAYAWGCHVETEQTRYGDDKSGLLCGYYFEPGKPARTISAEEGSLFLGATPSSSGGFLWLHFNLANAASVRWLRQRELPDAFYEALDHVQSTRVEIAGASVVAVINDVMAFGADASNVSTMAICVHDRLLVSARHTPLRSIDRLRESVRSGETFRSATELLAHLLRDQAAVMALVVRDATGQVDRIEDQFMASDVGESRMRLGGLRRMLVRLQRLLAPEPAALFRLLNRPPAWIGTEDVQDLRESAEEFAAAVTDCSALGERVRLLQEEVSAVVNEQTNRTVFVLTVVTVAALPMTIIPGLFGMNVGGLPLQNHAEGF